ncbi:hypothetical protein [Bradyrhizobium sp. S3.9.1]|uniref:hypothetical protein n=1 Tax=Bradyrhizobium sp. S3.9.1 TaxID=3156431 RepID=UPI003394B577
MFNSALESIDKFKWALLLLPGILTIGCVGLVTNVLKLTELQIFLLGSIVSIPLMLIIGGVLYLILLVTRLLVRAINFMTVLTLPIPSVKEKTFWIAAYSVALLGSPFFGVNLAAFLERDGLHQMAARLVVKGRLDADSLWTPLDRLRYLNTNARIGEPDGIDGRLPIPGRKWSSLTGDVYFEVHLKGTGSPTLVGWPRVYGARGSESEIYLSPACEIGEKQPMKLVAGPGVVIKEREVAFITLVDREDRNTQKKHECSLLAGFGQATP